VNQTSVGSFLLAANFAAGSVDIFNSTFAPATLTGSFSDPSIPSGYSPFGIHAINGNIFVTYAKVNAQGRETVGAGLGYVDEFDTDGNLFEPQSAKAISMRRGVWRLLRQDSAAWAVIYLSGISAMA
jgi:uncharacterized protein (TIGR03118 family)